MTWGILRKIYNLELKTRGGGGRDFKRKKCAQPWRHNEERLPILISGMTAPNTISEGTVWTVHTGRRLRLQFHSFSERTPTKAPHKWAINIFRASLENSRLHLSSPSTLSAASCRSPFEHRDPTPASRTLRKWQTQRNSALRQPKRLQVARPRMAPLPPAAEIPPPTKTKRVYSSAPRPPPAKRVYSSAHCLPTIDEDDGVLRRRVDVLAPRQPAKRVESFGLDQFFPSSPKEDTSPPPAPPPSPSPPSPSAPKPAAAKPAATTKTKPSTNTSVSSGTKRKLDDTFHHQAPRKS